MATQVRGLHGEIFNLDNEPDAVKHALEEDGVVVICQRSNITVPMNSLNRIQAMQVWGNLGYTTFEFLEKEIFMSADVGKVLFLLHQRYFLGASKLLIPIPKFKDPVLRSYNAYVAALFGGPADAGITFDISIKTAHGECTILTVNGGDILVCTEQIERSVPYTENGTVFISETSYYPPHITAPVRLAEKLVNDYLAGGGEELERDKDGNVIWSQENFMARI